MVCCFLLSSQNIVYWLDMQGIRDVVVVELAELSALWYIVLVLVLASFLSQTHSQSCTCMHQVACLRIFTERASNKKRSTSS